jgi:hypothetical protein
VLHQSPRLGKNSSLSWSKKKHRLMVDIRTHHPSRTFVIDVTCLQLLNIWP